MITLGYLVQAMSAFVFMLVSEPEFLVVPLLISAISGGMFAPAWKAMFTKVMEFGKEGRVWSFYDSGEAFVLSGGTIIAGLLATTFGYKAIFIPLFLLNLVAVALSLDPKLSK